MGRDDVGVRGPRRGHDHTGRQFTEDDWTDLDGRGVGAYYKSKTIAERAAWDFAAAEGGSMKLAAGNPVAVFGPVLGEMVSGANEIVRQLLDGALPGYPDLWIPVVDVRDVARAHLLAMTAPEAAGQRFIAASGPAMTMRQIGGILKKSLGERARCVPGRSVPDFVLRIAAIFDKTVRVIVPISASPGSRAVRRPAASWAGNRDRPRRPSSQPPRA